MKFKKVWCPMSQEIVVSFFDNSRMEKLAIFHALFSQSTLTVLTIAKASIVVYATWMSQQVSCDILLIAHK